MRTGIDVKEDFENYIKAKITDIKQIETERFPINFPALIVEYPKENVEYIGIRLVNNKFDIDAQLIMPVGINVKSDMEKLNVILEQIKTLVRTDPSFGNNFTQIDIGIIEPKNFSIEVNKDQSVEYLGYNISFVVYIYEFI